MTAVTDVHDLHKLRSCPRPGWPGPHRRGRRDHGFLGPNGAGKSTSIRVLLSVLRAASGKAALLGRDPWTDAVPLHRETAYVPGRHRASSLLPGDPPTRLGRQPADHGGVLPRRHAASPAASHVAEHVMAQVEAPATSTVRPTLERCRFVGCVACRRAGVVAHLGGLWSLGLQVVWCPKYRRQIVGGPSCDTLR
jgi:hypothetical protein